MIKVTQEKITPEQCLEWLENSNDNNRPVRSKFVNMLARDMISKRWVLNGESIKFDTKGNVLDGQHRMWACIEANKPFTTMVTRGLPHSVFDTLDTGEVRKPSDILAINGEQNVAMTVAALRHIGRYESGTMMNMTKFTNKEIEDLLDLHPQIREFVKICANNANRCRWCAASVIAPTWYLAAKIDPELAVKFFESFIQGTNLSTGSPILALRNKLIQISTNNTQRLSATHKFQIIVMAWNLWRKNKTIKYFKLGASLVNSSKDFPEFK